MARLAWRLSMAVTLALALAAPPAPASWRSTEQLGPSMQGATLPTIAGSGRGDRVAAWVGASDIQVAVSRQGGAFGPAQTVPDSAGGFSPRVAINGEGKAVIAWLGPEAGSRESVHVAGLDVDRGLGRSRQVTYAAHPLNLQGVAVGPRGRAAVLFTLDDTVLARASTPSGHFHHIVGIENQGTGYAIGYAGEEPRVLYRRSAEPRKLYEHAVDRAALSSRTVTTRVPAEARIAVGTAPNGSQAAVWQAPDSGEPGEPVFAGVRRAGGTFAVRRVAESAPEIDQLRAAIASSGAAVVGWPERNLPGRIVTAYRAPGKRFGRARTAFTSDPPAFVRDLELAINPAGQAVFDWQSHWGPPRVLAAFQVRGGKLRDVQDLGAGNRLSAFPANATIDSRGRAAVVWDDTDIVHAVRGRAPR